MMAGILRCAGEALYGPRWQSNLARALGCNDRTMRRYAAGTRELPPAKWQEIHAMLLTRADDLRAVADDLIKYQARENQND